jgi:imidazole glycerol-phosphate synthase subunit HisH
MIAIIDYGMGNLGSIKRKLDIIGIESIITDSYEIINTSEKIILPGVGHFGNAMVEIKRRGLDKALEDAVFISKKPILGICLGMQLMTKFSNEGNAEGLGWFDANVTRFNIRNKIRNKVPHTGWNNIKIKKSNPLFNKIELKTGFYFVHSYHVVCNNDEDILSETDYEYMFVSSIQRNNIYGVQFHPEKSHYEGELLLRNFTTL